MKPYKNEDGIPLSWPRFIPNGRVVNRSKAWLPDSLIGLMHQDEGSTRAGRPDTDWISKDAQFGPATKFP
jgi:hypothetical protein